MKTKGIVLIEIILAVTLIASVILFSFNSAITSEQYTINNLNYSRASSIAKEGLEAVLNANKNNFTQFVNGDYGIYNNGSNWFLSPSPNVIDNFFTRTINVSGSDTNKKNVISTVTWKNLNSVQNNTVSYTQVISNWQTTLTPSITPTPTPTTCAMASNFIFDSTAVLLALNNRQVTNTKIRTTSSFCPVVIDKMTVSWTKPNRRIEAINILSNVWTSTGVGTPSGSQNSGTILDIVNYTVPNDLNFYTISYFQFSGSMSSSTVTVTFTFNDSTTATYNINI